MIGDNESATGIKLLPMNHTIRIVIALMSRFFLMENDPSLMDIESDPSSLVESTWTVNRWYKIDTFTSRWIDNHKQTIERRLNVSKVRPVLMVKQNNSLIQMNDYIPIDPIHVNRNH